MTSALDDYLSQVTDPELRNKIRAEIDKAPKALGLVFERHEQEGIRMPKSVLEVGAKVIVEADDTFHHIVELDENDATLRNRAGVERVVPAAGVTVAREFGDIMYPGLTPVDELRLGEPGDPVHTVINGENYHALEMLQYTHAGKIDLIYVDPPYNTGNKTWKYNDRYIAELDSYRHSKWLSFMERRLLLAKKLLTPTGVIIVAIGDDEHHRLRVLMDQVFGERNFLANITWQGGKKNNAKYTSGGIDYMLTYARDAQLLSESGHRWREEKLGVQIVLGLARKAWAENKGNHAPAQAQFRKLMKSLKDWSESSDAVTRYTTLDAETGEPIRVDGDLSAPGGGGGTYAVKNPKTGLIVQTPKNGWRWTESRMDAEITNGGVYFGPDASRIPSGINRLAQLDTEVPSPYFLADRNAASSDLEKVLGARRFPYPKSPNVLMRWFRMVAPKDAVILDFFAGSGTTAEAVMRLNAEDAGTRQAILVTNNELAAEDDKRLRAAGFSPGDHEYEAFGVFEHVTKPRIQTIVTGIREDGSKYGDGIAANVALFELNYLDQARIQYGSEFDPLAGVFWLKAGAVGPLIQQDIIGKGYAASEDSSIAVLFRTGRAKKLAAELAATEHPNLTHIFIVADTDEQGNIAARYFDSNLIIERIHGSYLSAFAVNKKDDHAV